MTMLEARHMAALWIIGAIVFCIVFNLVFIFAGDCRRLKLVVKRF